MCITVDGSVYFDSKNVKYIYGEYSVMLVTSGALNIRADLFVILLCSSFHVNKQEEEYEYFSLFNDLMFLNESYIDM